jgi:hypothetical protein
MEVSKKEKTTKILEEKEEKIEDINFETNKKDNNDE